VEWFLHKNTLKPESISQEIRKILESQNLKVTVDFVSDVIRACAIYYDRMEMEKIENPALRDIEKFIFNLKRLIRDANALSYEARLEIGHLVETLKFREIEEAMERVVSQIKRGKGRPEKWARVAFIGDLAVIYYRHTGKKPGLPYLSSSKTKDRERRGPFFQFVKLLLGIVKNSPRLTDAAITTSIRKLIEDENKIFKLRKKHWPEFKANHPWEKLT